MNLGQGTPKLIPVGVRLLRRIVVYKVVNFGRRGCLLPSVRAEATGAEGVAIYRSL